MRIIVAILLCTVICFNAANGQSLSVGMKRTDAVKSLKTLKARSLITSSPMIVAKGVRLEGRREDVTLLFGTDDRISQIITVSTVPTSLKVFRDRMFEETVGEFIQSADEKDQCYFAHRTPDADNISIFDKKTKRTTTVVSRREHNPVWQPDHKAATQSVR